ncbi:MAG: glycosyltransferase family 4 protein [Dokdonella sp.]
MKAVIMTPVLAGADAVGNDVLAMAHVLRERGIETRLCCNVAVGIDEGILPPERVLDFAGGADDLLIYHFSVSWPAALEVLGHARGFRVVRYHNITPPQFFAEYGAIDYEHACASGRAEIPAVAALGCELYLGASAFNNEDLLAAGVPRERCAVLPPFHRIGHLLDAEADLGLLDQLNDGTRNVLMVGRVAPNKGHVELVDAFAAYVDGYGDPARLIIVGKSDPRLQAYPERIQAHIDTHRLGDRVWWLDSLSEAQLKAAYLASHAFMTLSRHEGFCVPLVEAMALGVPVVAYGSSAIPETVGDGGIVWADADPWLYAASLARLAADEPFRNGLRETARRRYEREFSPHVLRERFLRLLEPAL